MHVDGVANADTQEGTRHLAVEGPIAKGRAFGETAFQFDRDQINAHGLRVALAERGRNVGRSLCDVGFNDRLRWRSWRDQELSLHPGELMSWQAAKIEKVASLEGRKRKRGAGALAGDARRPSGLALLRKDNVVLGAFAVQQRDLHNLAFGGRQHRIDLAVDGATDADKDHAALCNARAKGVADTGIITGGWLIGRLRRGRRRLRLSGRRWRGGLRHGRRSGRG